MLLGIHVKNLALIDEVEVDFGEHLNIMTGETGAGKSVLIGSVNLALGQKASKDLIRKGAKEALVELFFQTKDENLIKKLEAMDISCENGDIIISRRIMPNRSVCRINGEIVSAKILSEISGDLIDIHGQHDHQSLLYKEKHLAILDDYAKEVLAAPKASMEKAYKNYAALEKKYHESNADAETRRREADFITYELQEIESAALKLGEDEVLEQQYKKMSNARKITENLVQAHQLTGQEASDAVSRALRCMYTIADDTSDMADLVAQLEDIENLLGDFNREVSAYLSDMTFEPSACEEVEQRLDLINHLKAKFGQSIEAIEAYYAEKSKRLELLENYDVHMENLSKKMAEAKAEYEQFAGKVSAIRQTKSQELAAAIENALKDLNFLDVQFSMEVRPAQHQTANGIDEAEFMISTNPGEDLKPLGHVASGGELSRIMLAIKSVLADADDIETLIFDEIDTGISGRTAQKVSERLAIISGKHQVLCISHLPQIAAMADHHFLIEKHVQNERTATEISLLEDEASAAEIARMLGGAEITDKVLENAREMKVLAKEHRHW